MADPKEMIKTMRKSRKNNASVHTFSKAWVGGPNVLLTRKKSNSLTQKRMPAMPCLQKIIPAILVHGQS
jgi:hypothetical protein